MSTQPYQTWSMLTNAELLDGAADYQTAAAFAHTEAVDALRRGMPDYAAEWQRIQALYHHGAAEHMRFLLRRGS